MIEHYHAKMVTQLTPAREVRWAVFGAGELPGLSFPDTSEGEATARIVADHLNHAYACGKRYVRTALRNAMRED